jgi:glycosyltransferase involved in cell wall biosynthesis
MAELFSQDQRPSRTAYDFELAEEFFSSVTYSEDRAGLLWGLLRRGLQKLLKVDFLHAWHNRAAISSADIVWTMDELSHPSVGIVRSLMGNKSRPAIIGHSIALFDHLGGTSRLHRRYRLLLASKANVLTFNSRGTLALGQELFPNKPSELIYFGISEERFALAEARRARGGGPIRVFANGNDRTRDWQTLVEALGNDDRFEVLISCGWAPDYAKSYRNVTVRRDMRVGEQVDCYRTYDWAVVPMVENLYSGITVALEAAASGIPVVAARTGGVPTYFGDDEVLFYPPGNPEALRDLLVDCTDDRRLEFAQAAQQRFKTSSYTSRNMIQQYVRLTESWAAPNAINAHGIPG